MKTFKEWLFYIGAATLLCVAMAVSSESQAQEYEHSVTFICCSWHHDRNHGYNEENYGLAYNYRVDKFVFTVGTFQNSLDRQAVFIAAGPHWQWTENVSFSLPMGLTTGYANTDTGKASSTMPSLFAMPTLHLYERINIHTVPGVVYAVSFDVLKW